MATNADPYRTLGLARGASLDEVKRAYRRLAKANHPDAAGEAALPRFLAIQAAYDQIVGPDSGIRATGRTPTGRAPWEADPTRAGATNRAYGGRSRRTSRTSGPRPGAAGRPPTGGPDPARPKRPERPPNKATLGSTSYDGADAEPFEPDWGGASWYGTTSGTYWTLNPKEYADPRKHGPEYQARARRGQHDEAPGPPPPIDAADQAADAADEREAGVEADAADEAIDPRASRQGRPAPPPPPTHTTASWWEATQGASPGDVRPGPDRAEADPRRPEDPPRPAVAGADAATLASPTLSADAALAALRAWVIDGRPGLVGRLGRAVFGWAPVALGISWIGGEISGCGRFAAACDPGVAPISWFAQLLALLLLLAVPQLARIAAIATMATIAAAVSGALLLSASSGPDAAAASRAALAGLIVIAWGVGLVVAVVREVRMQRPAGPVS